MKVCSKCLHRIFVRIGYECFIRFVDVTGDRVGLAITQSLTLAGLLQWGVRQSKYLKPTTVFFIVIK